MIQSCEDSLPNYSLKKIYSECVKDGSTYVSMPVILTFWHFKVLFTFSCNINDTETDLINTFPQSKKEGSQKHPKADCLFACGALRTSRCNTKYVIQFKVNVSCTVCILGINQIVLDVKTGTKQPLKNHYQPTIIAIVWLKKMARKCGTIYWCVSSEFLNWS